MTRYTGRVTLDDCIPGHYALWQGRWVYIVSVNRTDETVMLSPIRPKTAVVPPDDIQDVRPEKPPDVS